MRRGEVEPFAFQPMPIMLRHRQGEWLVGRCASFMLAFHDASQASPLLEDEEDIGEHDDIAPCAIGRCRHLPAFS